MPSIDELKQQAGYHAANQVESGMVVGLGHGSTAIHAVRRIGERLQSGDLMDVVGIPASVEIDAAARKLNIPLTDFTRHPVIDLTIDGADEVDPHLNLIKGGGGALLREKILAQASKQVIIVVDERKLSDALGTYFALPVEVIPFGWPSKVATLESLGANPTLRLREDGSPFATDQGNYILDCNFGQMTDPYTISRALLDMAIVVEHGLFLDIASKVVVAAGTGIREIVKQ